MNKRPNPHFSERTYLRQALEGADDIPANPSVRQMEALVGAGSGGGSSDFSIAHVTVTFEGGIRLVPLFAPVAAATASNPMFDADTSGIVMDVILYKGTGIIYYDTIGGTVDPPAFEVSGDITYDGEIQFVVTGDGTIAASPSSGGDAMT